MSLPVTNGEPAIKAAVLNWLRSNGAFRNGVAVSELAVGRHVNRADIAIINGKLKCFEIKSKRDNLSRIMSQIDTYQATFDEVTVVAATKHINTLMTIIPNHVGLIEVLDHTGKIGLNLIKNASSSPAQSIVGLLDLLPVSELKGIAKSSNARTRAELMDAASYQPKSVIRSKAISFLKKRYGSTFNEFSSAVHGRPIKAEDLKRLMAWTSIRTYQNLVNVDSDIQQESDIYSAIGHSFGDVPRDIKDLLQGLSRSNPHQPD